MTPGHDSVMALASSRKETETAHLPAAWSAWSRRNSEWWHVLSGSPRSVLLLDFDGTLAPLTREPMHATMYPGISERLVRLLATARTRLVLISGRALRDLTALLPQELEFEMWGSHGREQLLPNGEYHVFSPGPAQAQCLADLHSFLQGAGFNLLTEKKVGSVAIHTRGLSQPETEQIASITRSFLASRQMGHCAQIPLQWLPFERGFELRVPGCTKGTATHNILRDEHPLIPVAYLGDDQTDEDAFLALGQRDPQAPSLRVLVGREVRPSTADLWLAPPHEVLFFFDRWLDAVTHGEASGGAFR